MHPAQTLAPGAVEGGAGVVSQLVVGQPANEIDRARELDTVGTNDTLNRQFVRGAIQEAMIAPGLSPWIAGRVGIDGGNEGSLSYTGRALRVGLRHALGLEAFALSAGVGAASILTHSAQSPVGDVSGEGLSNEGLDWSGRGFSVDVPLSFGWQSPGEIVALWLGTRLGYEVVSGALPFVTGGREIDAEAEASRWFAGASLGASVGVEPVWVRVELDGTFHDGRGTVELPWQDTPAERLEESFDGISLTPAASLAVRF